MTCIYFKTTLFVLYLQEQEVAVTEACYSCYDKITISW